MGRVDYELGVLGTQCNDFVANLYTHMVNIEAAEQGFKQHVQSNFAAAERELNFTKTAADSVNAGSGNINCNVAPRVVMLEAGMQEQVATVNGNLQTQ